VSACQCAAIENGIDAFECFNCGRPMLVDASKYPVFDLRTQRMEQPEISTVAPDWQPLKLSIKRGTLRIVRHVAGSDRRIQLETLLEAA